jgi:hypothetical protein
LVSTQIPDGDRFGTVATVDPVLQAAPEYRVERSWGDFAIEAVGRERLDDIEYLQVGVHDGWQIR